MQNMITSTLRASALTALSLFSFACGGVTDEAAEQESAEENYELKTLEEFRTAIPDESRVEIVVPGPQGSANALTQIGDAELAGLAIESAFKVNRPARLMVRLLRKIVKVPPTLFDAEENKFLWGPWENDDGHGEVLVYIQENDEDADFRFSYAFVRLEDGDLSTSAPVIWGAATPKDDEEHGVGVTLWDFEANRAFEQAFDPDFDQDSVGERGRFAQVYGNGEGQNGDFTFNVAVFRDFLPGDAQADDAPANLDYFFGEFRGDQAERVDFVDWQLEADLCDSDAETCFEENTPDDVKETLGLRAAFVNRGLGRAEATISGGELPEVVEVVECWDEDINRTYMGVSQDAELVAAEGECAGPFDAGLQELGIPQLSDVDAEILEALDCVALNGPDACDE